MKKWVTEFQAVCAKTGELKRYMGPYVEGLTHTMAQEWCYQNAGHLVVTGELVSEIPCKPGTFNPDWDKETDYHTPQLN